MPSDCQICIRVYRHFVPANVQDAALSDNVMDHILDKMTDVVRLPVWELAYHRMFGVDVDDDDNIIDSVIGKKIFLLIDLADMFAATDAQ